MREGGRGWGGGEGMGDGEREGSGKGDREKGREKWEENNSNCVVAASRCSKLVEHSPTATSGGSIKDSLSHSIFVTPCELHFACSPSPALQAEGCMVRARAAEDTSPESSLPSVHIPPNEVVVVRYNGSPLLVDMSYQLTHITSPFKLWASSTQKLVCCMHHSSYCH